MRRIAILDAPSNLGLRPPTETSVPGCAKAPGALRDHGLLARLGARDAGCLTPPRYDPGDWRPGDGVCHAREIGAYSRKLADRIGAIIDTGEFPVILGGDCSIVLGAGLAMHRLGDAVGGRIGLVFVDGHSDFRHPGNASYVGAAAGEDLALVTGRGQADLAAMEGRRPYFRDIDVVVMGIRAQDEYRLDLQAAGIVTRPVPTLRVEGAARSAQWARDQLVDCAGFWVHVDMDVLDPAVMPAVDAPEPGGIAFPELELLLAGLVDTPHCLGVEITVFDPDYDLDGGYAAEITSALVAGLSPVRHVEPRPDLVAAREDLASGVADRSAPGRLRPAPVADEPVADAPVAGEPVAEEPWPVQQPDPVAARRAAAADDDVALAAAGASSGTGASSETAATHDAAAPATTLLGVEEAGAASPDESAVAEPGGSADWLGTSGARAGWRGSSTGRADWLGGGGLQRNRVEAPGRLGPRTEPSEAGSAEPAGSAGPDEPAGSADDRRGQIGSAERWPDFADGREEPGHADVSGHDDPVAAHDDDGAGPDLRPATRPLGSAPLLDSEPLPATRPGLLRPRQGDGFSLPAQRPAFDVGPEEPVDIA
jgi:arginase